MLRDIVLSMVALLLGYVAGVLDTREDYNEKLHMLDNRDKL